MPPMPGWITENTVLPSTLEEDELAALSNHMRDTFLACSFRARSPSSMLRNAGKKQKKAAKE